MIKSIIILLGLPGSGKGTQGAVLSEELAIPHISTGDILRKMVNEDDKDSKLLAKYMSEEKLSEQTENQEEESFCRQHKLQITNK